MNNGKQAKRERGRVQEENPCRLLPASCPHIAPVLIGWYRENGRELPWRKTTDPYRIWISEVILQQTRVVQGLDYFNRFIERFPDVRSLAEANQDEVLKYWQGLGYYSRARNLHAAARDVIDRFGGRFPENYQELLSLKGVGEYTAAAICSLAWKQPYAVVDGNVYRVLSRLFGIEISPDSGKAKRYFAGLAQELLDRKYPDIYNQAIMDFGAIQCLPKAPLCGICPLQDKCKAYDIGAVDRLPVKKEKKTTRPRYFNYLHIRSKGNTVLVQRTAKDIWQNLYEFPMIETSEAVDFFILQQSDIYREFLCGAAGIRVKRTVEMPKHILSHQTIYARFYELETGVLPLGVPGTTIKESDIGEYAISRLTELYLER